MTHGQISYVVKMIRTMMIMIKMMIMIMMMMMIIALTQPIFKLGPPNFEWK